MHDGHKDELGDNYRPTMPVNGRKVFEYERVVMEAMPETGSTDETKPGPDATDDYNEIFKSIGVAKQEGTAGKSANGGADSNKVQFMSFSGISVLLSIAIPVVLRLQR
jgi:hypothetical protein